VTKANEATILPLSTRVRRYENSRRRARLHSAVETAGWLAGSAGLFVVAIGGLLGLR
jgi:hypothetical protein